MDTETENKQTNKQKKGCNKLLQQHHGKLGQKEKRKLKLNWPKQKHFKLITFNCSRLCGKKLEKGNVI